MGVVYRARQLELNREVALKMVLAGGHTSATGLARFAAEIEAVARLDHPNVVRVLHAGHHAGLPFFAMELVSGGSVADAVKDGALEPREAARLVEQVARGVGYCHERGVLHRDLKPGNLLLTPDRIPKVTDFGLARLKDSEHDLTATGAVLGTPGYMAPEQAAGALDRLGAHTDVYGLGAVLYCLLTGRPPFSGAAVQLVLAQVQSSEPVPPSRLAAGVPPDLETICLKCLAKEPARRYPTAEAMADDLVRWLDGRPITARPAGPVERGRKWVKRNRGLTAAVMTIFVTVVVGAGVATWQAIRASEEASRATANAQTATENATRADANAQAARSAEGVALEQARLAWDRLYVSDMRLAHRAWVDARPDRLRVLLDNHRPDRSDGIDRRNFEWWYLDRASRTGFRAFEFPKERPNGVAYHPDGSRVVAVGRSGIRVWDVATGNELKPWLSKSPFTSGVAFSPDGKLLAVGGEDGSARVLEAATGREIHVLPGHSGAVTAVAFSPDSTQLATGSKDKTAKIWEAKTGKLIWTLTGPTRTVSCLSFSHDGGTVAAGEGDRFPPTMSACQIYLWNSATGKATETLSGHTGAVCGIAFDPTSLRLASVSWDGSLRLWYPLGKQPAVTLHASSDRLMAVAFSPDGTRLAAAGLDRQIRLWNPRTGRPLGTLRGHAGGILALAFGRDATTLVTCGGRVFADTADGEVLAWDLRKGQDPLVLPATTGPVLGVAFGPNGEFAAGGWDGAVQVWEADYSPRASRPKGHSGRVEGLAFDADGSKLATCGSDKLVRLWDAHTGQQLGTHPGIEVIYAVAFGPNGRQLAAVAAERKLRVWDANTGQELAVLGEHGYQARGLAFSPDGAKLATGSAERVDGRGIVKVWEVATGRELANLVGHGGNVTSVAFTPNGSRLVTGSSDGTVRVWNLASGRELLTLRGHAGRVTSVSLNPDGTRIASAGWDGTVRVWDTDTGQEYLILERGLGTIPGEDAGANQASSVAFSRDGTRLAAGYWDGSVRIWHSGRTDALRQPGSSRSP